MFIAPDFRDSISYLDLASIQKSADIIHIIDADMILKAYNTAWVNFAENNHGEKILEQFPIGSRITDAGEDPLRTYLIQCYRAALAENKPFEQNYECSSPGLFRLFRQTAYPLVQSRGLLISHHLVKENPHPDEPEFNQQFITRQGYVIQCANCRKIRDAENEHTWLWVPSLVENPLPNTSHGICNNFLDHYFPDIGR